VNVRRIAVSSEIPNRSPTIVSSRVQGNLSEHVGVPPGVGSDYGHFEVLGGGSEPA